MPANKDTRLYARFTLDFPDHPKIAILSDSAFRTLVSATIYSRRLMTDGYLAKRLALAKWSLADLQELCNNDPDKPSLIEQEDGWYIHDYDQQQDTRQEIEARRQRAKEAGSIGGRMKAAKHGAKPSAKRGAKLSADPEDGGEPSGTLPETERKTKTSSGPESAHSRLMNSARAETSPADDDAWAQATSEPSNLSPPVNIGASRLVAITIPSGTINDADRTALRIKASEGITKHHRTEEDMAECLRIWLTKPELGPNALLCCLTEVDKRKLAGGVNGRPLSTSEKNWITTQALKGEGVRMATPQELFGGIQQRELNRGSR